MKKGVIVFYILFMLSFVCADVIGNNIPIQIQTVDASGNIITGTFEFKIDISTSSSCTPVLYSNTSTRTTDARGIVSYNLENVDLNFSEQYWFCYYRDGVLKDTVKAARVPYTFRAKNVTLSGVEVNTNFNLEGYNITASVGNFGVQVPSYALNVLGNVNVTGNVTASYFIGDGSLLTGISSGGSGVPTGMIAPFNQASCPTGWILADGTSGTPDLRGIFLRGSGTSGVLKYANGSYFGIGYGTYQNDSLQGHWHDLLIGSTTAAFAHVSTNDQLAVADNAGSQQLRSAMGGEPQNLIQNPTTDGINGVPRNGSETSSAYYATIYCVKTSEDTPVSNTIWGTSGNNTFVQNTSLNVGIGTTDPLWALDVLNNIRVSGNTGRMRIDRPNISGTAALDFMTNNSYIWAMGLQTGASDDFSLSHRTLGKIISISNSTGMFNVSGMLYVNSTNVGIGAMNPTEKLNVVGNVNFTANLTVGGQLSVTGVSRVKAKVMTLSIPPTTHTIITYGSNSEVYDNLGELNTSYQFNSKQAGYYLVIAHAIFTNLTCNPNAYLYYYVYINGSTLDAPLGYVQFESSTSAVYRSFSGSAIVYLRAGDYMDVRAYHTCAYTSVLWPNENFNYLEIHRLS